MTLPPDDPRLAPIKLRKELLAEGHNDKTLARALANGTLRRPRTGAYVDGALWDRLTAEQRFALRVRAAHLQSKTDVVIAYTAPLPFHDCPMWGLDLGEVHLTRPDGKAGRSEAGIRQHCARLIPGDVEEAYGMQMTTPMRAALEVTTLASVPAGMAVMSYFLHRGDFTIQAARERYANGMTQWPNSLRTDLVLRLSDARLESIGECRAYHAIWSQGLPLPILQYEVFHDGVLVARLDFALPDHRIWIEFDGRVKYEKYVPDGQSVVDVVLREKQREDLVRELTGWRCLRITWADLADPVRLAVRIRAFIAQGSKPAVVR